MRIEEVLSGPNPSVQEITQRLATDHPRAKDALDEIRQQHSVKRYYEMSQAVFNATKELPPDAAAELLVAVLSPLLPKLNCFAVALMVDVVAMRMGNAEADAAQKLAEFFSSGLQAAESPTAGTSEKQQSKEAQLLLRVTVGALAVRQGDLALAQEILLSEVGRQVAAAAGVAPQLSARLHRAAAWLFRSTRRAGCPTTDKPHELYNALTLYLSYQRLDELTPEEVAEVARDLVVAGMLSPRMFDFSELVDAPVLAGLSSEDAWLRELVSATAACDVALLGRVCHANQDRALELFGHEGNKIIEGKLQVSLLLDLCFRHSTVSIEKAMERCGLESRAAAARLFMRAAGANVLRGRVDGPNGKFIVDWVLPRAPTETRLEELSSELRGWRQRIRSLQTTAMSECS